MKMGKAFGEAAKSIVGEVENLTVAFGKKESVENFSDSLGTATDALTTFANFLKDHDKEVAKAITLLPKLYVAFKGFKIVSAVAPGVKTFAGAIVSMTGKGIATLAGKLFGVAAGEKAVGIASKESSGTIVESAKAFVAIGAGVALIAAGFSLLAYSAVQIAQAGPLAAGVLIGMTGAVAGLMVVAKNVAPAMTAGATGFIAFGAAVLIAAAGIAILSLAAVNLANAGPLAIGCMVGMVAAIAGLALGAAALGPALTAGAVGLVAFGVAILLVSTGALLASVGLAIVAGVLPTIVQYGIQGAACIATLGAGMIVFGAGAAVAGAGCIVLGAGLVVVGAGLTVVGAAVLIAAAGVLLLGSRSTCPWRRSYGSWGRTSIDGSCIPCCIIRSFSNGRSIDSLNSIIIRSCGRNGSIGCCSGSIWSCYGRRRSWHPCNGGSIKVCQFKHEIHSR